MKTGKRRTQTNLNSLANMSKPGMTNNPGGRPKKTPLWASTLKTVPTTVAGIEQYLRSGLLKGIGPVFAKKLVGRFGAEVQIATTKAPAPQPPAATTAKR